MIQQVLERLSLDGHVQIVQTGEVRSAQPTRFMDLAEEHFLGRPLLRLPLTHASLQRPLDRLGELPGKFLL